MAWHGQGNTDMKDLAEKAAKHKDALAALMITYPSTHGVFEDTIVEICQIVHDNGGLVYMDGANMNAQVPPRSRGGGGPATTGDLRRDVAFLSASVFRLFPSRGLFMWLQSV